MSGGKGMLDGCEISLLTDVNVLLYFFNDTSEGLVVRSFYVYLDPTL